MGQSVNFNADGGKILYHCRVMLIWLDIGRNMFELSLLLFYYTMEIILAVNVASKSGELRDVSH